MKLVCLRQTSLILVGSFSTDTLFVFIFCIIINSLHVILINIMKKIVYGVLTLIPGLALAQVTGTPNTGALDALLAFIARTVRTLIPIFFGIAIIYFFWGLIVFLRAAGDPKAQENGRNQMIWGVIAIAVMISVYGLVAWLQNLFGISPTTSLPIPTVPGL